MKEFEKNGQVSVRLEEGQVANTYLIDSWDDESETVLLYHTRFPLILLRFPFVAVRESFECKGKGSEELTLDFCRKWTKVLDAADIDILESLEMVMVVKRRLSKRMKLSISMMLGKVAQFKLNDNVEEALSLAQEHSEFLDSFNLKRYNKLLMFLAGDKPITSEKQRISVFNLAGFVMSQIIYPDQF